MAILQSNQVAVRPLRIETALSAQDIRGLLNENIYGREASPRPQIGWGAISDPDFPVGSPPAADFTATTIPETEAALRSRGAVAARFYWWQADTKAERLHGSGAEAALIHRLAAADILIFDETGGVSVLTTVRDDAQFNQVRDALGDIIIDADRRATVVSDTLKERIPEDLFLWLLYRLQWQQQLSGNLYLGGIREISSMDRSMRGAKFQDEATVDRVELAALVAIGTKAFGPAKAFVLSTNPDADFHFELHADGGFQAYRSSEYTDRNFTGADQAVILAEDMWTQILPQLREAHRRDEEWEVSGRTILRQAARDNVLKLIHHDPADPGAGA